PPSFLARKPLRESRAGARDDGRPWRSPDPRRACAAAVRAPSPHRLRLLEPGQAGHATDTDPYQTTVANRARSASRLSLVIVDSKNSGTRLHSTFLKKLSS